MKWRHVAAGAVLALASIPAGSEGLPDLGEVAQTFLTPQMERRIGNEVVRQIAAQGVLLDDPEIADYLNHLGYRLVAQGPEARQPFEFFLVQDPSINAFALPGGFIGVHTGLILASQSESELASVLAHEIAHVTQRHLARMVAGQRKSMLTSLAGLAVALLASRYNSQIAEAAIATTQASAIQSQLDYTREHEREADRIGIEILQRSGLDPSGFQVFFERMQKAGRVYEVNAPAYLRTHPLSHERIADVQSRVEALPYRQVPDSLDFQLARAKLRAMQGAPRDAVEFFETGLADKKFASEVAQRYGLTLALVRAGSLERAGRELAALRRVAPPNPLIETLAGRLAQANGQLPAALDIYRTALQSFPSHRALVYDYAGALVAAREPAQALTLLDSFLKSFPDDGQAYRLQAEAHAAQGRRLLQHQSLAEAYISRGNLVAAIQQLELALKSGDGDFYQISQVEARLRELRKIEIEIKRQQQ